VVKEDKESPLTGDDKIREATLPQLTAMTLEEVIPLISATSE
jgi:hypothetical protein